MPMSLIERFNIGVRKSFAILNQGLELNDSLYEIKHVHLPMLLKLQPPTGFFDTRQLSSDSCCIFRNTANECPLSGQCLLIILDFDEIIYSAECVDEFLKELSTARKSFHPEQLKLVDNQCINILTDLLHLESVLSYLSISSALDKSLNKEKFVRSLIDILISNFELLNDIIKLHSTITKLNESSLPIYTKANELPTDEEDHVHLLEDHMKSLDLLKIVTCDGKILYHFLDQSRHPPVIIYNDESINLFSELNHIKYQSIILLQTMYCYCDINWYIYTRNMPLVYPTHADDYYHYDRLAAVIGSSDKLNSINNKAKSHKNSIDLQFMALDYGSTTLLPLLQLGIPFLTSEVVALLLLFSQNPEIVQILQKQNVSSQLLQIIEQENGAYFTSVISKIEPINIVTLTKFSTEIENSLKISLIARHSLLLLLKLCDKSDAYLLDKLCKFTIDYLTIFSYDSINKAIQLRDIATTHLSLICKCLNKILPNNSNLSLQRICIELLYILNKFKPNSDVITSCTEIQEFYSELCKFLWLKNLNISSITTSCILLKDVELPVSILDSKSKIIYDKYKLGDLTLFNLIYMLSIGNNFQNEKCQVLLEKLMYDEILVNKYWDIITSGSNVHSVQNWLQDILCNINDDKCIEQQVPVVSNLLSIALVPQFDLTKLQCIYGVYGNILQSLGTLLQSIVEICDFQNSKYCKTIKSILYMYLQLLLLIKYYKTQNTNLLHFVNWKSVIAIMSLKEFHSDYMVLVGISSMILGLVCDIFQVDRFYELGIDLGNSISDYPNSITNLVESSQYVTVMDSLGNIKFQNKFPNDQLNSCENYTYVWNNYQLCKLMICIYVYKTFVHEKAMNVLLELAQQNKVSYSQPHIVSFTNETCTPNVLLDRLNNAATEQQNATREIAHLYSTISKLNRQMAVLAKAYFQADDSLRKVKYDLEQLKTPKTADHNLQVQYEELKFKHEKLLELLGRIEEKLPEAVTICRSKFE